MLQIAYSCYSLSRYEYLDRVIRSRLKLQPKSLKFVTAKVAADSIVFGPLDLLIFFSYMGFASGRTIDQVKEDVKRDFLPALLVGGTVWPLVQVANFRFVPVRYQLLYVNLFCLLDSSFLSWVEQQGDAPWKQWFMPFHSLENQKSQTWITGCLFLMNCIFMKALLPFFFGEKKQHQKHVYFELMYQWNGKKPPRQGYLWSFLNYLLVTGKKLWPIW